MPQVFNSNNNIGMLDVHRSIIQKNHQALTEICDIDLLLPKLLEKRVFSNEMAKRYQIGNDKERKDKLFKGILKRGPKAFDNLLAALTETGQVQLVDLLTKNLASNNNPDENVVKSRSHAYPFQLPIHEESIAHDTEHIKNLGSIFCNVNLQTEPLKVVVEKATRFYDDIGKVPTYRTRSRNRGAVLIFNYKHYVNNIEPTRNGSEVDVHNLKDLFTQMKMYVEIHTDKGKEETKSIINNFSTNPLLKLVDMIFVFVMSHGDKSERDTSVVCSDGHRLETAEIEDEFNNKACLYMQKKPKIFIYQVCRGKLPDYGTKPRVAVDSALRNKTIRTRDDMLIAHSTLPYNESHRDIYLGSWYIQLICEVFMKHACDTHIEEMLKIVDNKLENLRSENQTMQTSVYTNQGFKNCYIHPGIYYEDDQIKDY